MFIVNLISTCGSFQETKTSKSNEIKYSGRLVSVYIVEMIIRTNRLNGTNRWVSRRRAAAKAEESGSFAESGGIDLNSSRLNECPPRPVCTYYCMYNPNGIHTYIPRAFVIEAKAETSGIAGARRKHTDRLSSSLPFRNWKRVSETRRGSIVRTFNWQLFVGAARPTP